jgi:hypothetical protein
MAGISRPHSSLESRTSGAIVLLSRVMENNRLVRLGKEFRLFAADANALYLRQTVPARIRYIDNIFHFNQTGAGRPSRTSRRPNTSKRMRFS